MKKLGILTVLIGVMVFSQTVDAKNYVWTDPDFGFSLTFPDSWKTQGGLSPEQQFEAIGPDGGICVMEASQDRRFVIHPRRHDKEILATVIDWPYWEDVTANYEDRFFHFDKTGGIGKGDARFTVVDYEIDGEFKRELVFSSIYGDMAFIARCSAEQSQYDEQLDDFMGIISSVDYAPAYSAYKTSYYRDFLREKPSKPFWYEKIKFTNWLPRLKERPIYTDK